MLLMEHHGSLPRRLPSLRFQSCCLMTWWSLMIPLWRVVGGGDKGLGTWRLEYDEYISAWAWRGMNMFSEISLKWKLAKQESTLPVISCIFRFIGMLLCYWHHFKDEGYDADYWELRYLHVCACCLNLSGYSLVFQPEAFDSHKNISEDSFSMRLVEGSH